MVVLVKSILLGLARPLLLLLHLALYRLDVCRAPFPVDVEERRIAGPDPDRLLFIGDVAVAGYGVLHHGMTAASRTAHLVAQQRKRGCWWETIAAADLTAARVARMASLDAAGVDAAVIMLGVPDVLLGTRPSRWARNLRAIAERLRAEAEAECRIIFIAIPPMADFRPIPAAARKLLMLQTKRLNEAMRVIASEVPNATYVPFPKWRAGEKYVAQQISWKNMHKMLARLFASVILQDQ